MVLNYVALPHRTVSEPYNDAACTSRSIVGYKTLALILDEWNVAEGLRQKKKAFNEFLIAEELTEIHGR